MFPSPLLPSMFMLLMISCAASVLVMFLVPRTTCLRRVPTVMILLSACFMLLVGCSRTQTALQTKARNRNVLFITLDTTRADHLSCYNAGRTPASNRGARTPCLDALAGRGSRFSHATSQVPLTLPSHACIFTGTYP